MLDAPSYRVILKPVSPLFRERGETEIAAQGESCKDRDLRAGFGRRFAGKNRTRGERRGACFEGGRFQLNVFG